MSIFSRIALLFFVVAPSILYAQEDWENDGEIEDVEVEIVKDRQINLPKANRNFDKIPPLTIQPRTEKLEYFYQSMNFELPDLNIRVRPLKMKSQPISKIYGNYIKAGFGNYVTPYVEGYLASKRNKEYMYGAHLKYLSFQNGPVDDDNSGSGMFDIDVFGKLFNKSFTASGMVGFKSRNYNFYGYGELDPDVPFSVEEQKFDNFFLNGSIENTDKSAALQYYAGLKFDYLTDDFNAKESEVQLDFSASYHLGDRTSIDIISDLDLITQEDDSIEADTRNIFRISPALNFEYEGFRISAGFNAVYENDTLGDSEELHFYPAIRASYDLTDNFQVYAGIRGDIEKNTLRSLTTENPFLAANTPAYNQDKTFEFYGGIDGKLSSKVSFGAGVSAANYKNMYFYLTSPEDQTRFITQYSEDNTGIFNLFGELSFNRDDEFRMGLRTDVFAYDTPDDVAEAWHKPNYKITFNSTYNLYDKLLFGGEIYALGGIQALDNETENAIDLDAAFDVNLKAEYLISKQISTFIRLNNLFGQQYELLLNYPSRELQFMIGATYSF
ncbi:MAG: hypothetical protein AAGA02_06440 [Bacteroidota bacterium]